ncbi:hypothetical protein RBH26_05635 [Natronolimnohabitans sp. A-GB9]|uniref:hypothetical protein n=1 Tax=Natronolimnohabitans sp. A-GB9 TaxID=3069757 RepID=UPI0027B7DC02|nr:hypothetical protein [Natronolimnohabitans sp. A-GB9]MDQ2049960.1 hypothetical protein [Natronolimnohabitans sp. A-GB9]
MAHERRSPLEPAVSSPDLAFTAGFGFYLGLVAAGAVSVAALVAGASTEALLATAPGTVTAVLLAVLITGERLRGIPEQIGRRRRSRAICYVPAAAFAAVLLVPAVGPLAYTARFAIVTIALAALTAAAAVGVARMARNRYVEAVTVDEPAATWTGHRTGFGSGEGAISALMGVLVVVGLAGAVTNGWIGGVLVAVYGVAFLLGSRFDLWDDWDESDGRRNPPTFRAHQAGLVFERPYERRLLPWAAIEDVRLTADELVLERDGLRFDIRCDRSAIDDPEAVLETIERTRKRAAGDTTELAH